MTAFPLTPRSNAFEHYGAIVDIDSEAGLVRLQLTGLRTAARTQEGFDFFLELYDPLACRRILVDLRRAHWPVQDRALGEQLAMIIRALPASTILVLCDAPGHPVLAAAEAAFAASPHWLHVTDDVRDVEEWAGCNMTDAAPSTGPGEHGDSPVAGVAHLAGAMGSIGAVLARLGRRGAPVLD